MRWRTESLKSRLLLILLCSLALLQLLSFGAIGVSRGFEARHLANAQTAQDVRWLRTHLLSLSDEDRAKALPGLRRGSYHVEQWPADRALDAAPAGDLRSLRQAVAEQLPAPLEVKATGVGGMPALAVPLEPGRNMMVVFDEPLPSSRPSWWLVLWYVGIVTALVAAVAMWAVVAVSRPLERLSAAGAQMVADIAHAAPLQERGPAEVRMLAAGFNQMQRAVQAQLRERTFILAAISHDLKTPLTRLKLRLADAPMPSARIASIEAELDTMDALINEGLDYARSAQLRETRSPVDLVALLESQVHHSMDLGLPVRLMADASALTVLAAPRALGRLVQNLIDNALRYGGQVDVMLQQQAGQAEIQVADRGPGLAAQDMERMFEPFVRGESSRDRATGGTGLGLAIARNIALAHEGRIWLTAREGGGLIAHVTLPLHQPNAARKAPASLPS